MWPYQTHGHTFDVGHMLCMPYVVPLMYAICGHTKHMAIPLMYAIPLLLSSVRTVIVCEMRRTAIALVCSCLLSRVLVLHMSCDTCQGTRWGGWQITSVCYYRRAQPSMRQKRTASYGPLSNSRVKRNMFYVRTLGFLPYNRSLSTLPRLYSCIQEGDRREYRRCFHVGTSHTRVSCCKALIAALSCALSVYIHCSPSTHM